MFAALFFSHEFCLESKSLHLHPPKNKKRHNLGLPACSSFLGALLLLWHQETSQTYCYDSPAHLRWSRVPGTALPPLLEGTCGVPVHTLGSRNWVVAEAPQTLQQNVPGCYQEKISMGIIIYQFVTTWSPRRAFLSCNLLQYKSGWILLNIVNLGQY